MNALDLSKQPPRSPYFDLGGIYMLARTIDKMRAAQPGGNLGDYQIAGFSERMAQALGINLDDLQAVVALADSDDEVLQWVQKHGQMSNIAQANAEAERLTIADRLEREGWLEKYPIARTLDPKTPLLRMLELDDSQSFGFPAAK